MTRARMPSHVDARVGWFDRLATAVAGRVAKSWFFAGCVAAVLVWGPSLLLIHDLTVWQLLINTPTTILTTLLLALLQNTQARTDASTQTKLNALADALADWMMEQAGDNARVRRDVAELRAAVGLEDRESA